MDAFKELEQTQINTCWPDFGEDIEDEDDGLVEEDEENEDLTETIFTNRNKELVKFLNENCVICCEGDSANVFRQCGHECICDDCYQNRINTALLSCVVCRT